VYYPVFFDYFHIALEEFFRAKMGARAYLKLLDTDRIGFPAVHAECDYRAPLRFADEAATSISLERLGTKSVALRYRVSRTSPSPKTSVAEGVVVCAVTDLATFQSTPMTQQLRDLFLELGDSVR